MITKTCMVMKDNREEQLPEINHAFPYSAVFGDLHDYVGRYVPWHWHEAIEIVYIVQGSARFYVGDEIFSVTEGNVIFINHNTLHMLTPFPENSHVVFHTLLFDACFISGGYGSIFEQKYVNPILSCINITGIKFQQGDATYEQLTGLIRSAYALSETESFGYEFKIRNQLSETWLLIWEASKTKLIPGKVKKYQNAERVKVMLNYIHKNYMNRIELRDIASSANVSERECLRCFQKLLSMSPVAYLTTYRIRAAAGMLIHSDETIMNIVEAAGFSSSSYFSKIFRLQMGCTPREYRGKNTVSP